MRILALETTDKTGGAALLEDSNILAETTLDRNRRSAQSLVPAVRSLLELVEWSPKDVQLVGVSIGPGSFTGLRIGVTTAKVFAYAVGAEVLGINTLEAIALAGASRTGCQPVLHAVIDAQRGDVVAQPFSVRSPDHVESLGPQELRPVDRLPSGVTAMEREFWFPRASAVGRLAARHYAAGRRDDLWKLVPHYCRRSAAEEKWEAMGK